MRLHLPAYRSSVSGWQRFLLALELGLLNWQARRIERRLRACSTPYDFIEGRE